jgi:hypothetical protein
MNADRESSERDLQACQPALQTLQNTSVAAVNWRYSPAATVSAGKRLQRRHRAAGLTAVVAAAGVLVGAVSLQHGSTGPDTVAASPGAHVVAATACPHRANEPFPQRLASAADALQAARTEKTVDEHFTGVSLCEPTNTLTVYRIAGSAEFDSRAETTADHYGINVAFVDTEHSLTELDRVAKEINQREPQLRADGVELHDVQFVMENGAYLLVGVYKGLDEARRDLSAYADIVHIIQASTSPTGMR